jgi:hypothetical protein
MADYKDRMDDWREAARRKARELDEKFKIKERVEDGARAAQDAAIRGASRVASEAERARAEAERLGEELGADGRAEELREQARRTAEEVERLARAAGERVRGAGRATGERAGAVFEGAKKNYERAARVVGAGARVTRLSAATGVGLSKAYEWARHNPKQAVMVTLSVAAGVQGGAFFPRLDGVLLGAHPHWLTHSALPVWALRKAGSKFDSYLRERETLIGRGACVQRRRGRDARHFGGERRVVQSLRLGARESEAGRAGVALDRRGLGRGRGLPTSRRRAYRRAPALVHTFSSARLGAPPRRHEV